MRARQDDQGAKHGDRVLRIALDPRVAPSNRFVEAFTASVTAPGVEVVDYSWRFSAMRGFDVVIFHWPRDIQRPRGLKSFVRTALAYSKMIAARRLHGTRFLWIAHNLTPHDGGMIGAIFMRLFLRSLDGMIHLSHYSRALFEHTYGRIAGLDELVTVHGDYRDWMVTPPTPMPSPGERLTLAFFGQVRPYKNLERLLECFAAAERPGMTMLVAGMRADRDLADQLVGLYGSRPDVRFDLRDALLPEADIEAVIDQADAVVLPYRNILNSGAAIMALSRNRPVIAPAEGGFPELRDTVGADWVFLYEGELSAALIAEVEPWLRDTPRGTQPDLSAYDWAKIGPHIHAFVAGFAKR